MDKELVVEINKFCRAYEKVFHSSGYKEEIESATKDDLAGFILYLAASDGTITWDETNEIIDLFDGLNLGTPKFTPSGLAKHIREHDIYSVEFEQTPPLSFELAIELDILLKKSNKKKGLKIDKGYENTVANTLLEIYKDLGNAFMNAKGQVDENEINNYKLYIEMLKQCREKRYAAAFGPEDVHKQEKETKPAGVKAPSKRD